MSQAALQALFSGLPQYGPGSNASTRKALSLVPDLPPSPRIFDLDCGGGRQSLELARQLKTKIVAVDLHQPYLDELQQAASKQSLGHIVETRCISMDNLIEPLESIDLIWSEGAAYTIGVENALSLWRPLLRPGGLLAFTELTWFSDSPPEPAAAYWGNAYPDMSTVAANQAKATQAGYEVIGHFPLPPADWTAFYQALNDRIKMLQPQAQDWPELASVILETEQEVRMFQGYSDHYGYVFYILRSASRP